MKLFGHKKLHNSMVKDVVLSNFYLEGLEFLFYNIQEVLDSFELVLPLLEFVFH